MTDRIRYTARPPTEAELRIWPTADHVVEPVPRSCMPPPGAFRPYTASDVRAALNLEELQRQATAAMTESMRLWSAALDAAAQVLLARECRGIHRVVRPDGSEELWIDVAPDAVRIGELMPGRCVYRQRMQVDGTTISIVKEWVDPELAP